MLSFLQHRPLDSVPSLSYDLYHVNANMGQGMKQ
jgi:hypothetical protein